MTAEINIGVPIKTHGPWPDLSRMYVGFAFSDYVTKEDIPVDMRYRDMIVFEKTGDGIKEYHLLSSTADESYVDKTKLNEASFRVSADAIAMHGSFFAYEKAIAFNIIKANTYHPICTISTDDLVVSDSMNGFSFTPGRIVDANITSEANATGLLEITCSAAHGLNTGDIVVLVNMNNAGHDKTTIITKVDNTKFTCDDIPYIAGAGNSAGVVTQPAYLESAQDTDGVFFVSFNINGTAAASNKVWKFELNNGILPVDSVVSERLSTNTIASLTASGIITVKPYERIWISGKNVTDTTDYTVKHMNLSLHKI